MNTFNRDYINNEKKHFSIKQNLGLLIKIEDLLTESSASEDSENLGMNAEDAVNLAILVLHENLTFGTELIVPESFVEILYQNYFCDEEPSEYNKPDFSFSDIKRILKSGNDSKLLAIQEFIETLIQSACEMY